MTFSSYTLKLYAVEHCRNVTPYHFISVFPLQLPLFIWAILCSRNSNSVGATESEISLDLCAELLEWISKFTPCSKCKHIFLRQKFVWCATNWCLNVKMEFCCCLLSEVSDAVFMHEFICLFTLIVIQLTQEEHVEANKQTNHRDRHF